MLQQRKQRLFRGRIGDRREEPKNLIHVKNGPQAGGAGLGAHPAENLVQQQRDKEHAFRIAEVRDRNHGYTRLSLGGVEHGPDIERLARKPGLKSRRRQQVVDGHREAKAILRGEEALQVHDANLGEWRLLDLRDQAAKVEVLPGTPGVVEDGGEERVFAALDRVCVDADKSQKAGGCGVDPVKK